MSETLRDLVVSLSLNSDNFTRNIKSINKQIQEAESAFRLASAGVENFETTTAGLSFKLSTLQRTFQLQQDAIALSPSSSSLDRPTINDWNAAAGSLSHRALNCCPVIPATLPKSSSASPPVADATSILINAFEKAEPPIWASMPTEDNAAAKPNTCASVRPTCLEGYSSRQRSNRTMGRRKSPL